MSYISGPSVQLTSPNAMIVDFGFLRSAATHNREVEVTFRSHAKGSEPRSYVITGAIMLAKQFCHIDIKYEGKDMRINFLDEKTTITKVVDVGCQRVLYQYPYEKIELTHANKRPLPKNPFKMLELIPTREIAFGFNVFLRS